VGSNRSAAFGTLATENTHNRPTASWLWLTSQHASSPSGSGRARMYTAGRPGGTRGFLVTVQTTKPSKEGVFDENRKTMRLKTESRSFISPNWQGTGCLLNWLDQVYFKYVKCRQRSTRREKNAKRPYGIKTLKWERNGRVCSILGRFRGRNPFQTILQGGGSAGDGTPSLRLEL